MAARHSRLSRRIAEVVSALRCEELSFAVAVAAASQGPCLHRDVRSDRDDCRCIHGGVEHDHDVAVGGHDWQQDALTLRIAGHDRVNRYVTGGRVPEYDERVHGDITSSTRARDSHASHDVVRDWLSESEDTNVVDRIYTGSVVAALAQAMNQRIGELPRTFL